MSVVTTSQVGRDFIFLTAPGKMLILNRNSRYKWALYRDEKPCFSKMGLREERAFEPARPVGGSSAELVLLSHHENHASAAVTYG